MTQDDAASGHGTHMGHMSTTAVWSRVLRIARDDPGGDDSFEVLCDGPEISAATAVAGEAADRDLVIVVHPGDAVEAGLGPEIAAWSASNQDGMARELELAMQAGVRVVVIHRTSSQDLVHLATAAWRGAVQRATAAGCVLYGDGVDAAGHWLAEHVVCERTQQVLMLGAYASLQYGCITAVGQAVAQRWPSLQIRVSAHAPADTSDWGEVRWDGSAAQDAAQDAEALAACRSRMSGA